MRSFYKLPINVQNVPLMTQIMQSQDAVFDSDGLCKSLPPDAKKVGLGVLQITNGTALTGAELHRVDHDHRFLLPAKTPEARYIAVLSGQLMCLVGEECPAFNAGEVWWVDSKAEAIVLNKSGDDAVMLALTIRMD